MWFSSDFNLFNLFNCVVMLFPMTFFFIVLNGFIFQWVYTKLLFSLFRSFASHIPQIANLKVFLIVRFIYEVSVRKWVNATIDACLRIHKYPTPFDALFVGIFMFVFHPLNDFDILFSFRVFINIDWHITYLRKRYCI